MGDLIYEYELGKAWAKCYLASYYGWSDRSTGEDKELFLIYNAFRSSRVVSVRFSHVDCPASRDNATSLVLHLGPRTEDLIEALQIEILQGRWPHTGITSIIKMIKAEYDKQCGTEACASHSRDDE